MRERALGHFEGRGEERDEFEGGVLRPSMRGYVIKKENELAFETDAGKSLLETDERMALQSAKRCTPGSTNRAS